MTAGTEWPLIFCAESSQLQLVDVPVPVNFVFGISREKKYLWIYFYSTFYIVCKYIYVNPLCILPGQVTEQLIHRQSVKVMVDEDICRLCRKRIGQR